MNFSFVGKIEDTTVISVVLNLTLG